MRLDRAVDGTLSPSLGIAGDLVRVQVGANPRGIEVDSTGARLFVMNYVSRDVSVIDTATQSVTATLPSTAPPAGGSQAETIQRGKRLFNTGRGGAAPGLTEDARAPRFRMSDNGWGSCFNCHPFGLSDGVTWIFDRGPRQTTSLDGSFDSGDPSDRRILNWTAVRSSVQDFEKNTENVSGGFGLDDVNGSGDPIVDHGANVGLNVDLDAIAAYVQTIRTPRAASTLDASAVTRGRLVFQNNCTTCHSGPKWTRSRVTYPLPASTAPGVVITDGQIVSVGGTPVLRDVGTFSAGGPLEIRGAAPLKGQTAQGAQGYNPPSLIGVAASAPYMHDGRFATLEEVLAVGHGTGFLPLPPGDRTDLAAFLRSIDETTAPFAIPP
jgi:YVTN family beta-propeller protein